MGCSPSSGQQSSGSGRSLLGLSPWFGGSGAAKGRQKSGSETAQHEVNDEYVAVMAFLNEVPLFQRIPRDQHPILAGACRPRSFAAGQVIIKQGEQGSEFFVIRSGVALVLTSNGNDPPAKVATLNAGDYFGEKALLRQEPRAATVKAKTEVCTLTINREKFQELRLHESIQFHNRKAVGGDAYREVRVRPPAKKNKEQRELIASALLNNSNLQAIVSLDPSRIKELVDVAWMEDMEANREVIKQGNLLADYFYVVQEGSFRVMQKGGPEDPGTEKIPANTPSQVGTVEKGGSFGELALLYSAPRAATVQAIEDSIVWVIDRNNFKRILMKVCEAKVDQYVRYLQQCEILSGLTHEERRAVARAMVEVQFRRDEVIMSQGEPGSTFYVIYDGEVSVEVGGVEKARLEGNAAKQIAQHFGERALLKNEPCTATVRVTSETALALALSRESFNLLLNSAEDVPKREAPSCCLPACCLWPLPTSLKGRRRRHRIRSLYEVSVAASKALQRHSGAGGGGKVQRRDLRKVGFLGCGGFGTVWLWEHRETGEAYAMKCLGKGLVVKMGMQECVMTEKFVLQMTNSPFIIRLYETYSSERNLYFLLEPAMGGELHRTYDRRNFYGSVTHAKYYLGCVILALEHLHKRHIIYRDLKPENLLLNSQGLLKITDMGLSKFVIGKTYTTCGTPDYFAPEMLDSTGHTNAVDWWCLGILAFELMAGQPPFTAETHADIFRKVVKGIGKVRFPATVTGTVADMIRALLQKEPSARLPMRPDGAQKLKDHAWFSDFDWQGLEALGMEPPYKPTIKSRMDLANFSACKEDLPPQVAYQDDGSGWDKDFASAS